MLFSNRAINMKKARKKMNKIKVIIIEIKKMKKVLMKKYKAK